MNNPGKLEEIFGCSKRITILREIYYSRLVTVATDKSFNFWLSTFDEYYNKFLSSKII